jgi:uncharacterized membrane protein (TIGR02234 family)
VRKGPLLAALLCVAGASVVLVGAGRAWVLVEVAGSPLLPDRQVAVDGTDLAPGLRALGLLGLAGVPALAASRGRGRLLVGLVVLLTGLGVLAVTTRLLISGLGDLALLTAAVRDAGTPDGVATATTGWPVVAALGGLLLAAGGLLVMVRGPRWAALGRRYDAPAPEPAPDAAVAVAERDLWEALDRGEDPTAARGAQADPEAR